MFKEKTNCTRLAQTKAHSTTRLHDHPTASHDYNQLTMPRVASTATKLGKFKARSGFPVALRRQQRTGCPLWTPQAVLASLREVYGQATWNTNEFGTSLEQRFAATPFEPYNKTSPPVTLATGGTKVAIRHGPGTALYQLLIELMEKHSLYEVFQQWQARGSSVGAPPSMPGTMAGTPAPASALPPAPSATVGLLERVGTLERQQMQTANQLQVMSQRANYYHNEFQQEHQLRVQTFNELVQTRQMYNQATGFIQSEGRTEAFRDYQQLLTQTAAQA